VNSLTLSQAAKLLNLSVKTLQSQSSKNKLKTSWFGPIKIVARREVERYRAESLGRRKPKNKRDIKPLPKSEETATDIDRAAADFLTIKGV